MKNKLEIRALEPTDFPDWLPLWNGNNLGQRDEAITTDTWTRLLDSQSMVKGLCARQEGRICGIIHYILHPITGALEPVCYMQDLYIDPEFRQKGIAKKLVRELARIGKKEKWTRMYWLAEANNVAAQKLYKNLGVKLDFTLHALPLT